MMLLFPSEVLKPHTFLRKQALKYLSCTWRCWWLLWKCTRFDVFGSSYFCWALLKKAKKAISRVLIVCTWVLLQFHWQLLLALFSCFLMILSFCVPISDIFSRLPLFANRKVNDKLYKVSHVSHLLLLPSGVVSLTHVPLVVWIKSWTSLDEEFPCLSYHFPTFSLITETRGSTYYELWH